ncbi:MAG: cache domain-containing protein [Treponema sp.]|uniref:hypothetical protein n=1 Tax=Treponema sp. TaxID=166 RepID=UPI0025D7043D|nr:hypothetical protein [Treponema sp.]MBR0496407.1 cache domain-containing protein [Treponema sp.]
MSSGQKVAFSLLISVLAFCAFTVVAFSGLFDLLEVNFYQPIVQEIKQKKIDEIAAAQNEYFDTLMKRFDAFSVSPDVKTYAETRPSDESAKNREILRAQLVTSTQALFGIRIIDDNGRNVYYSTFQSDIISGSKGISYRNYDSMDELSYDSVHSKRLVEQAAPSDSKCRIIKDGDKNRLIFSLPFYNTQNEFTGTILFYCDAVNFSQFLYNRNLIDIKGFAKLVTAQKNQKEKFDGFGGFVFGLPNYGKLSIEKEILENWRSGTETFWKLKPAENLMKTPGEESEILDKSKNNSVCAFSYKNSREDFGFITLLYDENELKFPPYIRILLLVTAFVTLYLAIFLILSFKHDDIVVIRDKVRRYENEFFIGYKKMGDGKSPEYLAEQKPVLERRILKSLGKKGEKHAAEFKSIFESYWQEMLASFGESSPLSISSHAAPVINAEELKKIVRSSLEDILENGKIQINAAVSSEQKIIRNEQLAMSNFEEMGERVRSEKLGVRSDVGESPRAKDVDDVEEIPQADDVEETEELDEVEEVSEAESVEEVESVEDVESLDEVEEAETVEEVESVEEADDLDEVEEIPEAEDVESLDEVEDAESVEEVESVEDVESVEEAEELDAVEEIPEAEDVESLDELENAESVEEVESVEDAEEIPEAESVEEAEELDAVEEIPEAEDVESLDVVEDADTVEEVESVEEAEELDEIEELSGVVSEADVSDELEPISDIQEELRIGDGRDAGDDGEETNFSTVTEEERLQKFDEELEMLPEVSEHEEQALDMARTLAALPERPPHLNDDDNEELDSEGLSRKFTNSELHDIEKLKDAARSIDEVDTNLEELETFDPTKKGEEPKIVDPEEYIPHLLDNNVSSDDDVYKDEVLLEKIEFGVPSSDIVSDDSDGSAAENFVAASVDYSGLDEDDSDDDMYESVPEENDEENEVIFENPAAIDENQDENPIESDENPGESDEISNDIPDENPAATDENQDENPSLSDEIHDEISQESEKFSEEKEESAEIQYTEIEEPAPSEEVASEPAEDEDPLDDADYVVPLEYPGENMPFMFTKFGSDMNSELMELAPAMGDAIVQDSDGTFHVTEFSQPNKLSLNMDFKKLVDSILR